MNKEYLSTNSDCLLRWVRLGILILIFHDVAVSISPPLPQNIESRVGWKSKKFNYHLKTCCFCFNSQKQMLYWSYFFFICLKFMRIYIFFLRVTNIFLFGYPPHAPQFAVSMKRIFRGVTKIVLSLNIGLWYSKWPHGSHKLNQQKQKFKKGHGPIWQFCRILDTFSLISWPPCTFFVWSVRSFSLFYDKKYVGPPPRICKLK